MKFLDGKVTLVAGGARDIGRVRSAKIAAEDTSVAVNYFNSPGQDQETVKEINSLPGTVS